MSFRRLTPSPPSDPVFISLDSDSDDAEENVVDAAFCGAYVAAAYESEIDNSIAAAYDLSESDVQLLLQLVDDEAGATRELLLQLAATTILGCPCYWCTMDDDDRSEADATMGDEDRSDAENDCYSSSTIGAEDRSDAENECSSSNSAYSPMWFVDRLSDGLPEVVLPEATAVGGGGGGSGSGHHF